MTILFRTITVLLLSVAVVQQSVQVQDTPGSEKDKTPESSPSPDARKAEHENLQELVHEIMAARLARQLGLNDEETVILFRRLGEYRTQISALQKERQETLRSLRAILKQNGSEKEIEETLSRLQDLDAKLQELKPTAFEKVSAGMSVTRRARLYVFCNDFENEMRRLVQKARERAAQRRGWGNDPSESPQLRQEGPSPRPPQGPSSIPGRARAPRPLSTP